MARPDRDRRVAIGWRRGCRFHPRRRGSRSRFRTEERLILLPDLVGAGNRHIARRIGVAVSNDHRANDVRAWIVAVPVPPRRPVGVERIHLGRALRIRDGRERLVRDAHGRGGASSLLRLLRCDDRDGLAEVAHPLRREHRLIGELEAVRLPTGDVLAGEDGAHARHTERLGDVDLEDAGMRVRAADGLPPEHPGRVEVARVGELARDLGNRIGATRCGRRSSAPKRAHGGAHRPAARWTASRIFW